MNPEPVDFGQIAPPEEPPPVVTPVPNGRTRKAQPKPQSQGNVEQEPPQNLDAEEMVLGAMLISGAAIDAVKEVVNGSDFWRETHGIVYRAAVELHASGSPVDAITLTDFLGRRHTQEGTTELQAVGGKERIHELAALVPAAGNAAHYAGIVREMSALRGIIRVCGRGSRMGWERPTTSDEIMSDLGILLGDLQKRSGLNGHPFNERLLSASAFLDRAGESNPIWGDEGRMFAASGETTLICGPQGVGKTTLAQRYMLARAGFVDNVLGVPVKEAPGRVLYIAADRPDQAARSFQRMARDLPRDLLDERICFWKGPPPFAILKDRKALASFCIHHGASDVILDSLKDFAPGLATDEIGALLNIALQETLAEGIEILGLHHQRKAQQGMARPRHLDDVYGSTWITSGAGSVLLLWGEAGDTIVELDHLKQPAEPIGPLKIVHNHVSGAIAVQPQMEIPQIVAHAGPSGISPQELAMLFFGAEKPTDNQVERMRTACNRGIKVGQMLKIEADVDNPHVRYRIREF